MCNHHFLCFLYLKTLNPNKQAINNLLQTSKPNLITLKASSAPVITPPAITMTNPLKQQQPRIFTTTKINDELTSLLTSTPSTISTNISTMNTANKNYENELDDLMSSIEQTKPEIAAPMVTVVSAPQPVQHTSNVNIPKPTQHHNDSLNSSLIDDFAQLDGLYDSNESTTPTINGTASSSKNQWCDVDITKNTSFLVTGYKLPTHKDNLEVCWFEMFQLDYLRMVQIQFLD